MNLRPISRSRGKWPLLLSAALLIGANLAADEKVSFKHVPAAILKMDGKQVKFWDLYQADKRGNMLLVQLGRRYLLLDAKDREVSEVNAGAVESKSKGDAVVVARTAENEKRLESDAWSIKSVGPAVAIKVLLVAEGRMLEIQLPLRPNERREW